MGYNPYFGGYPQQPFGQPPYGGMPYGGPFGGGGSIAQCEQSVGLGGRTQNFPLNGPVNLQYVVQQVQMYLSSQGFQVSPFVGQMMAVIQAQHHSLFGMFTDSNAAYTIRICEGNMGGQWMAVVETGLASLMRDLMTMGVMGGGAFFIGDELLHNKLLEILGGGMTAFDAYNTYKQYANEEQLMNIIGNALMSSPPLM